MRILRPIARIWTLLLGAVLLVAALGLAMRLLVPLAPWGKPPAVTLVAPANGAHDVAPRSTISLRFSQPMNRRAVERALSVQPASSGYLEWRDDSQTLLLIPAAPLDPGVTYTLRLDVGALSSDYRALPAPIVAHFRTAPAPSVVVALPSGAAISPTTPIAIVFSRPMVAAAQLGQPLPATQLRFSPPLSGQAHWVDQSTLLFSPDPALQPATAYTATLDASLNDLTGTPLGAAFSWRFSTKPPALLRHSPENGARDVAPAQPLRVELSQPVDIVAAEHALTITPPVSGTLTGVISGTGQTIVFTPTVGWAPDTTYQVALAALKPVLGTLPLPASAWSFITTPRLRLVGRFPGQGQLLPPDHAILLIFSSPVNTATLTSGLAIDPPPVAPLQLGVSGAEVRLQVALAPATAYTITLDTSITDAGGTPLDHPYHLRLLTAPAPPALAIAGVSGRFVYLPADRPATLLVERTNLAALDLSLYQLDEATLLRAVDFDATGWRDFSPERYNQPQLRAWHVALDNDQPGQPTASPLPIGLDEAPAPLPPGLYYLRVRSAEGPAADLVLLVSSTLLTLQYNDQQALMWASDANGAPVAGLPLALYQGSGLVARGITGADGLWRVRHARAPSGRYFVLAERNPTGATSGAAVSGDWRLGTAFPPELNGRYRALLLSDQPTYPPTATVRIGGLLREVRSGRVMLPEATPVDLTLQPLGSPDVLTRTTQLLRADGVISAALALNNAPPGAYLLRASVGGATFLRLLMVAEAPIAPLAIDLVSAPDGARLRVATPRGLPIANAPLHWQLDGLPTFDGGALDALRAANLEYSFGDDTLETSVPLALSGSGTTAADGTLPLPPQVLSATQRLALHATVQEPGAPPVQVVRSLAAPAQPLRIGIRFSSNVARVGESVTIDLLALEGSAPVAGTQITLAAQRAASDTANRQMLGQATTDASGRATLRVALTEGGPYRLIALAQGAPGQLAQSARTLWVAPPDTRPTQATDAPLLLVPDQRTYQPGDRARLLVALPVSRTNALVTLSAGDLLTGTVAALRPDQPLDTPISSTFAPALDLSVVAPALPSPQGFAQLRLPVISPTAALNLALTALPTHDAASSAAITVTVRDDVGRPVFADLILAVTEDNSATMPADIAALTVLPTPAGIVTAHTLAALPRRAESVVPGAAARPGPSPANDQPVPLVAFWRSGLRTDAAGRLTLRIPLPPGPARWRVDVIAAAGATRISSARTTVDAPQPVLATLDPPRSLTVGDAWPASVVLHNRSAQPAFVTVTLRLSGLQPVATQVLTRPTRIAPGATQRLSWPVVTGDVRDAGVSWKIETVGAARQDLAQRIAVRPARGDDSSTITAQAGATMQREYFDPASGQRIDPFKLRVGQLVGVRIFVIVVRPLAASRLVAPLPATFELVRATPQPPFGPPRGEPGELSFALGDLDMGIYTQEYLVRATLPGHFSAPAPQLVLANGETIIGRSEHAIVE